MKVIPYITAVVLLIALTVASGALNGHLARRWGNSEKLELAGIKLQSFPAAFGDWELLATADLSEEVQAILECTGYVHRQYRNSQSGEIVSVAVLVGPSGPIATHNPEVCFSSREHRVFDEPRVQPLEVEDQICRLWTMTFAPRNGIGDLLKVYYGWNDGRGWSAPRDARLWYIGRPLLYKLQVAAPIPNDSVEGEGTDPCELFLASFLPAAAPFLQPDGAVPN